MSRAKGNGFERLVMPLLIEADGPDPVAGGLASSTGRIGHLDLGADGITRRLAVECKKRESIGSYLWEWLDHLDRRQAWREHIPVLVVGRNRRRPLAVVDLDYFCVLLREGRGV